MTQWIWQHTDWPNFQWDDAVLTPYLLDARRLQGQLLGIAKAFNQSTQVDLHSQALTQEMLTTSAIEGVVLERESVRFSIAQHLGLAQAGVSAKPDRYVEGLLAILLDAVENYQQTISEERLCAWQAALFPTGFSGLKRINVGALRSEGVMQIVSGLPGKTKIHFEAPPQKILPAELQQFLDWFNAKETLDIDAIVRAGIAHLWFEILHPFDDGNGRVGRTIIDYVLAQDEQSSIRFYSISEQILKKRKKYYAILDKTSKGNMDITSWLIWFIECYQLAIKSALASIEYITEKNQFWQQHSETPLNQRQRKVLIKMLDAGPAGFEGGMSTKKYMNITKTSRATAYREIIDLVEKNCLRPLPAKGRSSAYELVFDI